MDDPSSHLAAAAAGWKWPLSLEGMALYELIDITVAANSDPKKRKPKPHPRPWPAKKHGTKSRRPVIDRDQIRAELAKRGWRMAHTPQPHPVTTTEGSQHGR